MRQWLKFDDYNYSVLSQPFCTPDSREHLTILGSFEVAYNQGRGL